MKCILTLFLVLTTFAAHCQSCATTQPNNTNPLTVPDTFVVGYNQLPKCAHLSCEQGNVLYSEIIPVITNTTGHFRIVLRGWTGTSEASVAIMKENCDSVLGEKCLGHTSDSLDFCNTKGNFKILFRNQYHDQIIYKVKYIAAGCSAFEAEPYVCEFSDDGKAAPIPAASTYRQFDPIRGVTSPPTTEQPQGLSLRSDGVRVLRQGIPDGLVMIFCAVCIIFASWPWLRSMLPRHR